MLNAKLRPEVEGGAPKEAVFTIDLGPFAVSDSNVPVVNWDPEAVFRSNFRTSDLQTRIEEALASLAGKSGYNPVLNLHTPFGGGKSDTLESLLHTGWKR